MILIKTSPGFSFSSFEMVSMPNPDHPVGSMKINGKLFSPPRCTKSKISGTEPNVARSGFRLLPHPMPHRRIVSIIFRRHKGGVGGACFGFSFSPAALWRAAGEKRRYFLLELPGASLADSLYPGLQY